MTYTHEYFFSLKKLFVADKTYFIFPETGDPPPLSSISDKR